jgi:hypothetical protein
MPTYRARKITVRLIASSLVDCTTIDPSEDDPSDASRYERAILNGTQLAEHVISCGKDGFGLHFIKYDYAECPFFLVHAERELPDCIIQKSQSRLTTRHHDASAANKPDSRKHNTNLSSGSPRSPSTPSKINPDIQPYGLGVLIELTGLSAEHKASLPDRPLPDLRYDVFLNGDLMLSHYLPGSKLNYETSETVVAAGKKVSEMVERPMVVVPLGLQQNGELYTTNRGRFTTQERWDSIGKALAKQADDLRYWLKEGETDSPLAKFLDALATLEMPPDLDKLPPKGVQGFGIIDVVISNGRGTTSTNDPFMNRATLMLKEHCQSGSSDKIDADISPAVSPKHSDRTQTPRAGRRETPRDVELAEAPAEVLIQRNTPTRMTRSIVGSALAETLQNRLPTSRPLNSNPNLNKPSRKRLRSSLPSGEDNTRDAIRRSNRLNNNGCADSAPGRKTVAGFFQSSDIGGSKQPRTSPAKTAKAKKDSLISSIKVPLDDESPATAQNESPLGARRRPLKNPEIRNPRQASAKSQAEAQNAPANEESPTKQRPVKKDDPLYAAPGIVWQPQPYTTVEAWKTPNLCKDSLITYAEDGVWRTDMGGAGYLRQVPAVKPSHFEEDDVVFATRFFLC